MLHIFKCGKGPPYKVCLVISRTIPLDISKLGCPTPIPMLHYVQLKKVSGDTVIRHESKL